MITCPDGCGNDCCIPELDEDTVDDECLGHDSAAEPAESLAGSSGYPYTVYCDGSCRRRVAK